jgi:predicted transcriptional regulator
MPSHPLNALTRINSTVKELFIYLYDLSPSELDLLFIMIKEAKPLTLEELSNKADRDKSTVFRSVQKLVSAGICIKETRTIKEGGYYHIYSAVDMETFKAETEIRVRDLQKSLDRLMKKFETDMQKAISSFYQE